MTARESSQAPKVGVLLIHGLNGSRHDMEELANFLASHGLIAENMLLPGHGMHVRELMPPGWSEWAETVYAELRALKQRCDMVFLVGHSLGGALALHVAAHEEVEGVVAMCTPLHLRPWIRYLVRAAKYITPMWSAVWEDGHYLQARRRYTRDAYRWTAMRPVESILQFLPTLRSELPTITVPVLIMISIYDHMVPARDGREIYHLLGSREKHLVTFHRSNHVIMRERDREEVFAKTYAFIRRHADTILSQRLVSHTREQNNTDKTA